jgi:hypothetical protein
VLTQAQLDKFATEQSVLNNERLTLSQSAAQARARLQAEEMRAAQRDAAMQGTFGAVGAVASAIGALLGALAALVIFG